MSLSVHQSVLLPEVLEGLCARPGGCWIDGTLGGGGHSEALLDVIGPTGQLLGIDRDPDAIARTSARLARFGERFVCAHGNHADMFAIASDRGFENVDGILLDLGVSSDQLDSAERGFSFRQDGPLDMRMDTSRGPSVAEWLARSDEETIANAIYQYGEERQSRRIARAITLALREGRLSGTASLADLVERVLGGRKGARIHPATRTFQGLRMAVNDELASIEDGLNAALQLLKPGGRLAVISFHSLEDRLVKQFFRAHEGRDESLPQGGSEWRGELPRVSRVSRKAICPGDEECAANPRARSAKLRVIQKEEG